MRGFVFACALFSCFSYADAIDPSQLTFEVDGDQWLFQLYSLCDGSDAAERIHFRGIAPADGAMSRDALASIMATRIATYQNTLRGTTCRTVPRRIRKVDLVYTVRFSDKGYDILFDYKRNGTRFTEHHSWND